MQEFFLKFIFCELNSIHLSQIHADLKSDVLMLVTGYYMWKCDLIMVFEE